MSDNYAEWKRRIKESIYAAVFARMALGQGTRLSDEDIEAFSNKAGELAERWEEAMPD